MQKRCTYDVIQHIICCIKLSHYYDVFSFSRVLRADIQTRLRQVRVSRVHRVTFKIMPEVTNGLFIS